MPIGPQPSNGPGASTSAAATRLSGQLGPLSTKNADTYAYGNLGIYPNTAAVGGSTPTPQCDANGFLYITAGLNLVVPGQQKGKSRQIITFTMTIASTSPLIIADANARPFMWIFQSQQIALVTDSTFILSGSAGTAIVIIGEIYLQ